MQEPCSKYAAQLSDDSEGRHGKKAYKLYTLVLVSIKAVMSPVTSPPHHLHSRERGSGHIWAGEYGHRKQFGGGYTDAG